ncbi:MFS transporter [Nocardioides kongjuensis]|uniref:MFS family permease n=1 Tax=Nocardioides kongjuensis TaxID=349522 RepID=A0A852RJN7_9ACTN|nr:MFS transporter [Nocardioides kongjuensis]NYD33701.1 MFS family permease [Nocardioides kongjuensis]
MTATTASPTPTTPRAAKPTTLRAAAPAILALCLTMLVEMVDNSVLSVALPTIGRDLPVGPTGLQWIVGAYSLTFGGLLMVGGTLGDRLGRRRTLLVGIAGFGLASSLVVLATESWQLIGVRALCGVFAALIAPGTMSLVFRLFDDDELRRRAIGLIVSVAMVGVMVGPVLGGLAVSHLPWQALLVVNAPVAAIAFWGVARGIPVDDPAERRTGGADVPGAVLSVAMLGLILFTFTLGVDAGWTAPVTVVTASAALAAGVGFVLRERAAADPMLDLRLLGRRTVRGSAILQTGVMVAMVGVMFAATQLFQFAWGWTPLQAGLGTLPMVAGMFVSGPVTDALVARLGHRATALAGSTSLLVSLAVEYVALGAGYPVFAAGMVLLAVAARMVMTTSAVALIEALPEDHTGIGSALNDTAQEIGNVFGVAVVGTVTAAVMGTMLPSGRWSAAVVEEFLRSQRIGFAILAGLVAVITVVGGRTLTASRSTDEH